MDESKQGGISMRLGALVTFLLLATASLVSYAAPPLTCEVKPGEGAIPLVVDASSTSRAAITWTFGEGAVVSANPARHTYTRVGRYEVVARSAEGSWTGTVAARVEKRVTVGPNGGAAQVFFEGRKGRPIRIRLTGQSGMQPYAHVESAAGAAYTAANGRVDGGAGTWQEPLADDTRHEVTVFDGANQGGEVDVVIEEP